MTIHSTEDYTLDAVTVAPSLGLRLRSWLARWLLDGVHLPEQRFGKDSLVLTDKIRYTVTAAPTGAGEIGYDSVADTIKAWKGGAARVPVFENGDQTLIEKTLTTPTIASFLNAGHDHSNAAGGAQLTNAALATGVYAAITGLGAQTQALAMGSNAITGLANGVAATDAATKGQVDAAVQGLDHKDSVRVATAAALPPNTAAGLGVGKTLTMNALGILTVDGIATVLNDRVLVKDEATAANNGIYRVTIEGTAGVAAVLTRAVDYDQNVAGNTDVTAGSVIPVVQGMVNADTQWMLTTNDPITVDTTGLAFSSFGQLTDHGAMLGLLDDDHTQYARLAGRGAGQVLSGGADTGGNLTLSSTAHATKGSIIVGTNENVIPQTNLQGQLGTSGAKWSQVNAVTVNTGDLVLRSEDGSAHWRLVEQTDGILLVNENTGARFRMVMQPA